MKHVFGGALALAALQLSTAAYATHKGWIIQNPGSDCSFNTYSTARGGHGANLTLDNYATDTEQFVTCPLQLANRWGSLLDNGSVRHQPVRWAAAGMAKVAIENNNPGQIFDCVPRARFKNSTATYFGSLASTTAGGRRDLLVAAKNWGGNLEAVQTAELRSLDFDCRIPKALPSASASRILNYRVKICSNPASAVTRECESTEDGANSCDDVASGNCEGTVGDQAYVQTSGIECMSAIVGFDQGTLVRDFTGIRNTSSSAHAAVFCPLKPPADDSHRHERELQATRVYFNGSSAPSCNLQWLNQVGYASSNTFTLSLSATYVEQPVQPQVAVVGRELSMGVFCWLPTGTTIKGVTALVSESSVTGGT